MNRYDQYRQQWDYAGKGNVTPAPTHVDIELSSACNAQCPMCPQSDDANRKWRIGMMDTELAKRILADAKAIGVHSIKFNWRGEATLHPDFCEIIEYAWDLDFTDLMLNTNGGFIDDQILDTVMIMDTVAISIDTLRTDLAKILRPGLNLFAVINNLNRIIEVRDKGEETPARLKINFTIQKENEDELPAMKEYCRDLDIELFAKPEFPRVKMLTHDHNYKRKNCGFPFQRLTIDFEGNAYPCCVPWEGVESGLVMGSLSDSTLSDIWRSARIKKVRENVMTQRYTHKACIHCLSWASYVREEVK